MHAVVYLALRVAFALFLMFPINANLVTARLLARFWYWLMPRHRQRAFQNLQGAFGSGMTEREIRQITLRCMQQMTMMAMESIFIPRLVGPWTWPRYIRMRNLSAALEHMLSDRGVILVTGHYGNWELLGYTLAALGFDTYAVMRPLDNPYLNRFLERTRAAGGLRLLHKAGASEVVDSLLERGELVCFIADQDAGRKGIFVEFFGRQAATYKSIALLAIRHEVPIVVGYSRRLSPRFEYELGVERVITPDEWRNQADPVRWITQEYTRAIEAFVRRDISQYLWVHRRWKTRPRVRPASRRPARQDAAPPNPACRTQYDDAPSASPGGRFDALSAGS